MINENHIIDKMIIDEISEAINRVKPYGSIEIFVQNNIITQITLRNIKKMPKQIDTNNKTTTYSYENIKI
jgi:hypothetical protein